MLSLILLASHSRGQAPVDTLAIAKGLKADNKLKSAFDLLSCYQKTHPNDLNTIWLSAQTAYWMHRIGTAKQLYEEAIAGNPANYDLKLDYAKTLVDVNEFDKAFPLLNAYLAYDPTNLDVWITMTKIYYWQGNYTKAFDIITNIIKHNPENKEALSLSNEILLAKSPWLKIDGGYNKDNQPLQRLIPSVETGVFINSLATLSFRAEVPFFTTDETTTNALQLQVNNKSFFFKQQLKTDIGVGIVRFPYNNSSVLTGNLSLEKTVAKYMVLTIQAKRDPYFYSLSSIDTTVMENKVAASGAWKNMYTVNGIVGYSISGFADNNAINTFYGNLFTPEIKVSNMNFQLGYGFNYSTSKKNTFAPQQTLAEIIANSGSNLSGVYVPYFTPDNQKVNAAIVIINYKPIKEMTVGVSANYGFYAITQVPYFIVVKQGAVITGVNKDYVGQNFYPLELNAYLLWQVSKTTVLKVAYQYHSTFFYTNNFVGLSLKTSFWHDKK